MAYDEGLAHRIRESVGDRERLTERKMFGGIAFMLNGNMACGIVGEDLMLRIGPERAEALLEEEHVRPMDFTGRPMKGMVYVSPDGHRNDSELERFLAEALEFAGSLPAK